MAQDWDNVYYKENGVVKAIRRFSHWRHVERGSAYRVLGLARVQTVLPMNDDDEPLLYQDIHSPEKFAVRFPNEFADGRFEEISSDIPITHDFRLGLSLEASHQAFRWGEAHDRSKSAENWFWLVGYLAGKALFACIKGDKDKALHHCISAAAALMQWHTAILRDETGSLRGEDVDLKDKEFGG